MWKQKAARFRIALACARLPGMTGETSSSFQCQLESRNDKEIVGRAMRADHWRVKRALQKQLCDYVRAKHSMWAARQDVES